MQTTSTLGAPHILSARDAARYIGRSEITLRQWRSRGMGPPYIRQGRSISYLKSDLDRYLEEHRCGDTPKAERAPQLEAPRLRRRKRSLRRSSRRRAG